MIISYFIPEDGDTPDHPNFFISDTNTLTLGQLKKIFPVPGEYHFRFKKVIGSTSVWMDATNDSSPVPIDSNGNVFSKVSRISLRGVNSQITVSIPTTTTSTAAAKVTVAQEVLVPTSPIIDIPQSQQSTSQQQQPLIETKTRERRNSDKLLSFDNFDEPVPSPSVPAAAFSNDFLDFSAPSGTSAPISNSNKNIDLFAFDNLSSAPLNPSVPVTRSQSGNSMNTYGQTSGTGSPMSVGAMGRGPMGGPNPMGGGAGANPMGGRGNVMGFDAFNNMTPTQASQGAYRGTGQPGRR